MAVRLHDDQAENFLPDEFLTDEDKMSSSVQSELGWTDNEEDYFTELSRQITQYMIQEDGQHRDTTSNIASENPKFRGYRDLNCYKLTPKQKNDETWPQITNSTVTPMKIFSAGFCTNQSLSYDQPKDIQFHHSKGQHIMKQQSSILLKERRSLQTHKVEFGNMHHRGRTFCGSYNGRSGNHHLGLTSSAWPPLQHQVGSGMRAMFLGGFGKRNGSSGTGVFLPPGIVNSTESRKKQGCSTVIIPARVVQALKLHFDQMGGAMSPSNFVGCPMQHGALLNQRKGLLAHKNRHHQTTQAINHPEPEMCLPRDWTY